MNSQALENRLDRWLQRAAVAAMVAVALVLLVTGIVFYGPFFGGRAEAAGLSGRAAEMAADKLTELRPVVTAAGKPMRVNP